MAKFIEEDLDRACDEFAMLEYWPKEARPAVKLLLAKMCPSRESLRWLVNETVNHVGKWPGPADLRGLLCTRYDPADKIDQWCSLPGYTAAEAEMKYLTQHEEIKQLGPGGASKEIAQSMRQLAQSKAMPPAPASKAHRGGSQ